MKIILGMMFIKLLWLCNVRFVCIGFFKVKIEILVEWYWVGLILGFYLLEGGRIKRNYGFLDKLRCERGCYLVLRGRECWRYRGSMSFVYKIIIFFLCYFLFLY